MFVLEIIAGVLFLAILILGSIIVINASEGTETKITNSYNTYNINNQPVKTLPTPKQYIIDQKILYFGKQKIKFSRFACGFG